VRLDPAGVQMELSAPAERRARDRLIRDEHEHAATLEVLAQRFGVSVATVKRAIARSRTNSPEPRLNDPHDDFFAILDAQRKALGTCIREMESDDSSSARVGAAKATSSVGASIRDTLASSGKLPGRLIHPPSMGDALALDRELHRAVGAMVEIAERRGIDSPIGGTFPPRWSPPEARWRDRPSARVFRRPIFLADGRVVAFVCGRKGGTGRQPRTVPGRRTGNDAGWERAAHASGPPHGAPDCAVSRTRRRTRRAFTPSRQLIFLPSA
jgi:AraC-like DNA-binding protein